MRALCDRKKILRRAWGFPTASCFRLPRSSHGVHTSKYQVTVVPVEALEVAFAYVNARARPRPAELSDFQATDHDDNDTERLKCPNAPRDRHSDRLHVLPTDA